MFEPLAAQAEVIVSNVDKKTAPGERPVRLCNYMDVYSADYVVGRSGFMAATASSVEISRFALRPGDVVITKDSESPDDIGIAAVIDDVSGSTPLVCGYHLAVLRSSKLNPVFLAKQLGHHRVKAYLGSRATGSTRYGLTTGSILRIPLYIPSRGAQDVIGVVLRAMDNAIRTTEQLIAKLEMVKRGLIHDLLTKGIDENGEIRDDLPTTWTPGTLGQWMVGTAQNGLYKPGSCYGLDGTPIVRIDGFYDGVLEPAGSFKRVRVTSSELSTYGIDDGDILVNRVNSIEYVGKVALVQGLAGVTLFESNIMRVRVNRGALDPAYAVRWLCSPVAKAHLHRRAKSAIAQASVNQGDVRAVPMLLPPIAEQQRISALASAMEERRSAESESLTKLRLLKKGLADDLLTGRVRVAVPST